MNPNTKTILLTGASGFLGKHIKQRIIDESKFNVLTLGRTNSDIINDLGNKIPKIPEEIEYIVHAAGKAHMVPKTELESKDFYTINYQGTLNLLSALNESNSKIKSIVFISSVSVYGCSEGKEITEASELLAKDPYGKSKILAEKAILEFCGLRKINCCILRLPLIVGKNPPGNLGAMIRALEKGWYISIGKANNKKSMVMAEDIAKIIPTLFNTQGIYNLSDGYHPTFDELEKGISKILKKRKPVKIPQLLAILLAKFGDLLGSKSPINSLKLKKIQSELTFSDKKAQRELEWKPMNVLENLDKII